MALRIGGQLFDPDDPNLVAWSRCKTRPTVPLFFPRRTNSSEDQDTERLSERTLSYLASEWTGAYALLHQIFLARTKNDPVAVWRYRSKLMQHQVAAAAARCGTTRGRHGHASQWRSRCTSRRRRGVKARWTSARPLSWGRRHAQGTSTQVGPGLGGPTASSDFGRQAVHPGRRGRFLAAGRQVGEESRPVDPRAGCSSPGPAADPGVPEVPLHARERMLHPGTNRRLAPPPASSGPSGPSRPRRVQMPALPRTHRRLPLDVPLPALPAPAHSLWPASPEPAPSPPCSSACRLHVRHVRRRRRKAARRPRPLVHPNVRLRPEVPLPTLARPVHLRIPLPRRVPRRGRRLDEARVHNRPRPKAVTQRVQAPVGLPQRHLAQTLRLQPPAEPQDRPVRERPRQPKDPRGDAPTPPRTADPPSPDRPRCRTAARSEPEASSPAGTDAGTTGLP